MVVCSTEDQTKRSNLNGPRTSQEIGTKQIETETIRAKLESAKQNKSVRKSNFLRPVV